MASSDTDKALLCVGAVTGVRGLKGEVRIKSFTGDPKAIGDYGALFDETGTKAYRLKVTGLVKGMVMARFEGVNDRDAAEGLKGLTLFVPRDALPEAGEDEFYHADLVGLAVELVDGEVLGTVQEVHDYGAGAGLEISGGVRGTVMVPFTRAVVPMVDIAGRRMIVDPPPGLLEPGQPEGPEDAERDQKGRT
ncbi:MAG: ribosome maturation factor RimM [Rhodospirillaceae bacterium]|nr:ribosome maturation factor RimM [Rhodospirillaceae bacterium]